MAANKKYPIPVRQKWFGCIETPEVFPELSKMRNQSENKKLNVTYI